MPGTGQRTKEESGGTEQMVLSSPGASLHWNYPLEIRNFDHGREQRNHDFVMSGKGIFLFRDAASAAQPTLTCGRYWRIISKLAVEKPLCFVPKISRNGQCLQGRLPEG